MSLYSDTPDYSALELRRAQIGTCFPRPPGGSCYRELLPDVSLFRSKNRHRQIPSRSGSTRVEPPIGSTN